MKGVGESVRSRKYGLFGVFYEKCKKGLHFLLGHDIIQFVLRGVAQFG